MVETIRWLRRRVHLCAAGLLALIALVYLWSALVAGNLLSPASVLYLFAPWRAYRPVGLEQFWNPLLIDVPTAYYPWNVFARRMIGAGEFPAWNPYAYSGTPFFANAQTAIFSVFNVPLWVLPINVGIAVSAWLKLSIAGFGAYLLVRELKLGFWPGVLAGVCFSLCAFNVVWLTHETLPAVAALLPWAVWLCERLVSRRRAVDAIGLAMVCAFILAAGHPEVAAQVLAATVLYVLVRLVAISDALLGERLRRLGLVIAALAAGALLSATVVVPVLSVGLDTPGLEFRSGREWLLRWPAAKTALFPDWWGKPRTATPPGPSNYNERTLYAGTVALILACAAMVSSPRWRLKLPLVILGAVGIGVPFGVPVVYWLVVHLTPLGLTVTHRMILWFQFATAVLAAFGLQAVLEARGQRRIWWVLGVAAAVGIVAVVSLEPTLHELRTTQNHFRTGRSYDDPKVIALTSIGWWFIFVAAVAALLALSRRTIGARLAGVGIALVAALDMLHFSHGYQPMVAGAQAIPPETPAVAFLRRHAGHSRIVGIGDTLANDFNMVYGLHDARGYDPPQPSYRYWRLWQLVNPRQHPASPFRVRSLTRTGRTVISILGVRYVVSDPAFQPPSADGLSAVYRGRDAIIYRNSGAVSRAFVPKTVVATSNESATFRKVVAPGFDPRRTVIIERAQPPAQRLPLHSSGGRVGIEHDDNALIVLHAELPRPGVVVLNDALAKGWSVAVDGRPRPALRVNSVMRGVAIPAGSHRITWRYRVPGLRLGLLLTMLGGAVLLIVALLIRRRAVH